MVVAAHAEKELLGIQNCTRCKNNTQFHWIFGRRLFQGVLFSQFGGASRVNLKCLDLRGVQWAPDVNTGHGQKAIGSECPDKKTHFTPPIVQKLAADSAMNAFPISKVTYFQGRAVLARAVRKNPI